MATIILYKGDAVLKEVALCKERITIGRRPHNDIVIEDLAISGEHAVIVTHADGSFLEDLNSTNGTQVNGQPVRKHFLQDGDVIELAQFRAKYVSLISSEEKSTNGRVNCAKQENAISSATITVLNGPSAGKAIALTKVLTTLGVPGVQVAVVTRSQGGYYLAHVEGDAPTVNTKPIGSHPHPVFNGDVIDLSGIRMQVNFG